MLKAPAPRAMEERSIVIHSAHGTLSVRLVMPKPFQRTMIPATAPLNRMRPMTASQIIQGVIVNFLGCSCVYTMITPPRVQQPGCNKPADRCPGSRAGDTWIVEAGAFVQRIGDRSY